MADKQIDQQLNLPNLIRIKEEELCRLNSPEKHEELKMQLNILNKKLENERNTNNQQRRKQ